MNFLFLLLQKKLCKIYHKFADMWNFVLKPKLFNMPETTEVYESVAFRLNNLKLKEPLLGILFGTHVPPSMASYHKVQDLT
jgi:hypothetical protein